MIFSRLCAVLVLSAFFCGASALGQSFLENLTSTLNIEGMDTTYDPTTGLATATGDVHISYQDVEIRCGTASYNSTTGEVIAKDNVVVWKAGTTYKADSLIYNANTGDLSGDLVRSSMPVDPGTFFYEAKEFDTETSLVDRISADETFFTTHDSTAPNFRLRARQMTIYPEDRVVMRNVTVYAGRTPVFYLPYLSQSVEEEFPYRLSPGYTSGWGAFLLNQYNVIHGDHTLAKYHLDWRSERGLAVGADFISLRHRENQNNFGTLKLYYLHDQDPETNRTGNTRFPVDEDRYRINFQHRIYVPGPEKSTWYVDFDINKVSDIHFYEDFFFNDFRETPEPDNQVSLVHVDPAYTATLMTRFQLNDFYNVGAKTPEFALDFTRRPLWNTGLYHQGVLMAGFYQDEISDNLERSLEASLLGVPLPGFAVPTNFPNFANYQPTFGTPAFNAGLAASLAEPSFFRFHTYQELLYPINLFGWLNLVPRIGGGVTHYANVDGSPLGVGDDTKPIFHVGLDASFKLTKSWPDLVKPEWGIDGLRHVFQPYVNYSYLEADQTQGLPLIDRLSPTTRPRSIDVPLFTAIDDLRSWNIARVGMRNYLQTRRDYQSYGDGTFVSAIDEPSQTYSWAGLNTYVDVFIEDPEFDRSISNLYNELFFRPVPWLSFWLDWQLPLDTDPGSFSELNQYLTVMPTRNLSLTLGHQWVDDSPYFRDSNLIFSKIYAQLNSNWGLSMNHIVEMDDNTVEFQSYSLTRDLTSWIASVGLMFRNNRGGRMESGVVMSLTLKDFPQLSLPLDIDPNPSGRGGSR